MTIPRLNLSFVYFPYVIKPASGLLYPLPSLRAIFLPVRDQLPSILYRLLQCSSYGLTICFTSSPSSTQAMMATSRPLSSKAPATEFTLFPNLVIELQHLIWGFAASADISYVLVRSDLFSKGFAYKVVDLTGDESKLQAQFLRRFPPVLHATHDSRTIGFKYFHLQFDAYFKKPMYFNFLSDALVFCDYRSFDQFLNVPFQCQPSIESRNPNVKDIRRLVIGYECFDINPHLTLDHLARFDNLRELTLLVNPDWIYPCSKFLGTFVQRWMRTKQQRHGITWVDVPKVRFEVDDGRGMVFGGYGANEGDWQMERHVASEYEHDFSPTTFWVF